MKLTPAVNGSSGRATGFLESGKDILDSVYLTKFPKMSYFSKN
jgi:hypothetical protein